MKKVMFNLFLFSFTVFISCNQTSIFGFPVEDPINILKSQTAFVKYCNVNLKFSEDFVALDSSSKVISKRFFLEKLTSGMYLPLRLTSSGPICYTLYKINTSVDEYITLSLRNIGYVQYKYYEMEGKILPKFDYVDIEGKIYNPETTIGKIVVLKFWFIRCQKCVEEMPLLNKLVNLYKKRKDIVFLSLAFDDKASLKIFLEKNKFNYSVVADQEYYLTKVINVAYYPTHIVINKNGMVVKVVNSYEEMEPLLNKEASQ